MIKHDHLHLNPIIMIQGYHICEKTLHRSIKWWRTKLSFKADVIGSMLCYLILMLENQSNETVKLILSKHLSWRLLRPLWLFNITSHISPISFWSYLVTHATYIINRVSTPLLKKKIPYELLYNDVPDYTP